MFTWKDATQFAITHNALVSLIYMCYVPFMLLLQRTMKYMKPFCLRKPLMYWNVIMSTLSWIGFYITGNYLKDQLRNKGPIHTITSLEYTSGVVAYTVFLFNLSKILELIDTVFIVLRKRPLTFLHTFHHLNTGMLCWMTLFYSSPLGLWFSTMNLFVHGIMYGYFAMRYFKINIIPPVLLTLIQIAQMFWGIVITLLNLKYYPNTNEGDVLIAFWGLAMYAIYFYLFCSFFRSKYVKKKIS